MARAPACIAAPLSGGQIALVGAGLLPVQFVGGRLGAGLVALFGLDVGTGPGLVIAYLLVPSIAGIGWVWLNTVWREPHGWQGVGIVPLEGRWARTSVLAGFGCVLIGILVSQITTPIFGRPVGIPSFLQPGVLGTSPASIAMLLLSTAVLAPVMEELVFRGVLFGWLRPRTGMVTAALIAAALHAAVHLDLGGFFAYLAIFFALAVLYEKAESLWAPIIAHGTHNLIVLSLVLSRAVA